MLAFFNLRAPSEDKSNFSYFIRAASPDQKREVYMRAMKKATQSQKAVVAAFEARLAGKSKARQEETAT